VTFDGGLQTEPTRSPDGRYVAYTSTRNGKSDILVQQIGGGDPIQLTKGPGQNWQPDWSPDGKYIAYRSEEGDGGLFIMPALGGAGMQRKISSFGVYPRWSPDGRQILFLTNGWGIPCKLFVVDTDGGSAPHEVMPKLAAMTQIMSAVWHPDGRRASIWEWTLDSPPIPNFWTGLVNAPGTGVWTEITPEILKIAEAEAGPGTSARVRVLTQTP
jgi:Tol biopolymer transport system component